jgi:hypothetical protein
MTTQPSSTVCTERRVCRCANHEIWQRSRAELSSSRSRASSALRESYVTRGIRGSRSSQLHVRCAFLTFTHSRSPLDNHMTNPAHAFSRPTRPFDAKRAVRDLYVAFGAPERLLLMSHAWRTGRKLVAAVRRGGGVGVAF